MRPFLVLAALAAVIWARSIGYGQTTKVTNPDEYKTAMQAIGNAMTEVNKAVMSGELDAARPPAAAAKSMMLAIQAFWTDKKKDAPAQIATDVVATLESLETLLADLDRGGVSWALKKVTLACGSCHSKYRDQDPNTKVYSIKAGVL